MLLVMEHLRRNPEARALESEDRGMETWKEDWRVEQKQPAEISILSLQCYAPDRHSC